MARGGIEVARSLQLQTCKVSPDGHACLCKLEGDRAIADELSLDVGGHSWAISWDEGARTAAELAMALGRRRAVRPQIN